MKKIIGLMTAFVLSASLVLPLAACTGNGNSGTGGGHGSTGSTMQRENDFLEDEDLFHREKDDYVDLTPEDDGVLVDHIFEFEDLKYQGVSGNDSSNQGHKCVATSFEFNAGGYSGNICLKNIPAKSGFTLTIESDKSVRVPMEIRLSNSVLKESVLGNAFTITNNGNPVVNLSAEVPSEGGVTPSGSNAAYFSMVTVKTQISLAEGKNKIEFTAIVSGINPDYLNIQTSATLSGFEPYHWEENASFAQVTDLPTATKTGNLQLICSECGTSVSKSLPALTNACYERREEATEKICGIRINDRFIDLSKEYALTLQNATFADGSNKSFVLPGSTPDLRYTAPAGQVLKYWYNADDAFETYELPFVMPEKSLTIAPKFGTNESYTLTLKYAKFADGSESKQVMAGSLLDDLQVEIPEGRVILGWFEFTTGEIVSEGELFTMPEYDITVAPLFDAKEYAPTNGSAYGKVQMFPYNELGWIRNLNGTSYARVDMPKVAPDQLSWGTGIVGNEMGVVFTRTESSSENFLFTVISPYKVESAKKYMFTYTVSNLGSEEITLQLFQINSGMATSGDFATETFTLAAGETKTISLQTAVTGFSNDNVMTVFKFLNATQGFKLGTYQYVSEQA